MISPTSSKVEPTILDDEGSPDISMSSPEKESSPTSPVKAEPKVEGKAPNAQANRAPLRIKKEKAEGALHPKRVHPDDEENNKIGEHKRPRTELDPVSKELRLQVSS